MLAFNHRCGYFAEFDSIYNCQSNDGYAPARPGDQFWQFNLLAGYRFFNGRAEIRAGLLNLTGTDYQLNPINLYHELPRERMFTCGAKFIF